MVSPLYLPPIPADTSHAAKAAYSPDNFYLVVGDRLLTYFANEHLNIRRMTGFSFHREKPVLALVTIFQFREKLSDSQAVEATRTRVDWKYALHLSLNYPGMPVWNLCEYRKRLLHQPEDLQKFQKILKSMITDGVLKCDQDHFLEASQVLEEVCIITRSDMIFQSFQLALEALATYQPEWLRKISLPHWYTQSRFQSYRPGALLDKGELKTYMETFGADAYYLLGWFESESHPRWDHLEEIENLKKVWIKQFEHLPTGNSKLFARCDNC